jgi:hypothetical protein
MVTQDGSLFSLEYLLNPRMIHHQILTYYLKEPCRDHKTLVWLCMTAPRTTVQFRKSEIDLPASPDFR